MSLIILIQIYTFDRGITYDYYKPRFESWCKWLLTIGLLDLEATNARPKILTFWGRWG